MKPRISILLFLLAFLAAACLPQNATPPALPIPETKQPVEIPTLVLNPPLPGDAGQASGWVEYRDARYGYGLALPCFWQVSPTPSEGMFATMTARSYSDEYFAAHSERGNWTDGVWPEGAYKLDAVVFEGIASSSSMEIMIREFITGTLNEQELTSLQEVTYGRRTGYMATLVSGLQGGDTQKMIYFPIRNDALLGMAFQPGWALESLDIQAILGSLALTREESVVFPSQIPTSPPDAGSPTCQ